MFGNPLHLPGATIARASMMSNIFLLGGGGECCRSGFMSIAKGQELAEPQLGEIGIRIG